MSSPSGRGRALIACGVSASCPENLSRSAPRPTMPRQIRPCAGAAIMPRIGAPSETSAILIGVFVAPGDEFPRAVERVDQEIAPAS